MNTPTSAATPIGAPLWRSVLHHWPSVLGLMAAAFVLVTGADRETLAIVVCVATLCYVGAAALDRPWVAWAGIVGGSMVVVASELVGLAWWAGVIIAALALVVAGVQGRAPRRPLTAQVAAMVGFGGLAVAALFLAPRAGLVLVGVVLASHAVWDVIHYRRDQVVPRSLAEFCMLLDVPLGVGFIVLTVAGWVDVV